MTDETIDLDGRRGADAQSATRTRRHLREVKADQEAIRSRQHDLEEALAASPAASWPEAAAKARYLIELYAASAGIDPRHRRLIDAVFEDFERLSSTGTET